MASSKHIAPFLRDLGLSPSAGINELTAKMIVEELYRNGIDTYCLSPGGRSVAFLQVLEGDQRLNQKLFNDERDAAFWAQGYGKATGKPAVLLSTSGTAVANYLPATIEAHTSRIPMILVTCDRPAELLYAHANQTIDQLSFLRDYVSCQINLPAPETRLYPHSLLSNIDQLAYKATQHQTPVQLNIGFRKPFFGEASLTLPQEEKHVIQGWSDSGKAYTAFHGHTCLPSEPELARLEQTINKANSVLLVAGPLHAHENANALVKLAEHVRGPLLADIDSNCRFSESDCSIGAYNLFLNSQRDQLEAPDLVLYLGERIMSESLREYLESLDCPLIQIAHHDGRQDAVENEWIKFDERYVADPCTVATSLIQRISPKVDNEFLHSWQGHQERATERLLDMIAEHKDDPIVNEPHFFHILGKIIPEDSALFHSPSLVVREAEQCTFAPGKNIVSGANRGTAGIDGIISSALGFSQGTQKPCTLICGDQALLHDSGALSLVADHEHPLYLIVINNGGGAIFHFIPMDSAAQQTMENPHKVENFSLLAKHNNLRYYSATTLTKAEEALRQAYRDEKPAMIEVFTDGIESVETFKLLGRGL